MKNIKAILFDLDGTLLPMDMGEFMGGYFDELTNKMKHRKSPKELKKYIWDSTDAMIKSSETSKTNQEIFFNRFSKYVDNLNEYKKDFYDFYNNDFVRLKKYVKPDPIVIDIVEYLKDKDIKLVVATNPVFPKEAIYHRIQWAGLEKEDFDLITSYENMHFTKPNLEYYEEILDKIEVEPSKSMMVGNDMKEDMISKKFGLNTFYIDTYGIDKGDTDIQPDRRGSLREFYEFIKSNI